MSGALLEAEGISKSFGGLRAVSELSFAVAEGEILGLIGPNGAGKTTVFNLLSGYHRPDAGKVLFDGRNVTGVAPNRICRLGLTRTFQLVQPFRGMTVEENVLIGALSRTGDVGQASEEVRRVLALTGLSGVADRFVEDLTLAHWKRIEVARAVATRPRLLLLDEVLAGLNPSEVNEALELIRTIHQGGITILLIEHVMQAVMALSSRIVVLSNGTKLAEGSPGEVANNQDVVDAYFGDSVGEWSQLV